MGKNLRFMNNKNLTILVVSTDSYSDLWDNFFHCFHKYWSDCPYDVRLVNNLKNINISGVDIYHNSFDAQWSERTRSALMQIETRYICFMLEDFFISSKVDNKQIEEAIKIMEKAQIKYYKLLSLTDFISKPYKSSTYLQEITESYPYGISLMPAIWEKNLFLEKIGKDNYNPWRFEADRLREEKCSNNSSNVIGVFDNRNILNITHMVVQGKYLPPSIKKLQKLGFYFDKNSRETMSYTNFLFYKLKNYIGIKIRKYPFLGFLLYPFKRFSISEKYKS